MLPASHEAPHLRQRWVELFNAGSDGSGGAGETIPAFGVVEVIDSERPDSGGTATPDGGRTVLHVRRATTDMPKITVVNGPCEIPVGKYGNPGTMDSPMLALVERSDYTNGLDVGVKEGSFCLQSGYTGYRIIGDYDSCSGTMRVVKSAETDSMIGGCLAEDHPGRGVVFAIWLGAWDATNHEWDYDETGDPEAAIDWRYGVPYPNQGATGLFISRASDTYGTIWEVVALDCEVPEDHSCGSGSLQTP